MSFDEQLRRAFDTLTDRLHDEMGRQVQAVIDELAAAAQADREQAVAGALEQQPIPEPAPPQPIATVVDSEAPARLLDAIRTIDGAQRLSDILDALVSGAAREVDRVAVLIVRNGGYSGWRSVGFDPPFNRGESAELPAGASVTPIAIGGQAVAVLYTESSEPGVPNPELGAPNATVEILVRHAARCLESTTAFKAARAALATTSSGAAGAAAGAEATTDEEASARRYARLLVSEIKLYNEPAVVAGRRERDLATRLGGEIARARVLYDQRVPPQVRQQADYFHDELVRTLANGDRTLLELSTES